ncbi:MAG TPA: VCBS repeat-containing protein, partial [Tepidisphaeraceae bacterium]|nr:VCBS repeat-containing protein [Tepidisphaeraceae bacterium]
MLCAVESLEARQLLQGTTSTTPSFVDATTLSLGAARYAATGVQVTTDDRPFGPLFVTDLTGADEKNGSSYSKPTKPLDIVFLGRDGLTVLLGNGDGTFQTPTVYPCAPVATGSTGLIYDAMVECDVNGDGIPDFVSVESPADPKGPNGDPGSVTVFIGNGNGTFKTEDYSNEVGVNPECVTVADLDINGKKNEADIAVGNLGNRTVTLMAGNGNGTFTLPLANALQVGNFPESIAAFDVNGDGKMDLLVGNAEDETISVLLNNGGGQFEPQFAFNYGAAVLVANLVNNQPTIVTDFDGASVLTSTTPKGGKIPSFTVTTSTGAYGEFLAQTFGDNQFPSRAPFQKDLLGVSYLYSTVTIAQGDGINFEPANQSYSTLGLEAPYTSTVTSSNGSATATATVTSTGGQIAGYGPDGAATGDLTGDGFPDIVVSDYGIRPTEGVITLKKPRPPAITLLFGTQNGTFEAEKQKSAALVPLSLLEPSGITATETAIGEVEGGVDGNGFP